MNKTELVDTLAERTQVSKSKAKEMLESFEDVVVSKVHSGEDVKLTGFVDFKPVDKEATKARNPQTGEQMNVPAKRKMKAKVSPSTQKKVNNK